MSNLADLRKSSANPVYRWGLRPLPVKRDDHLDSGTLVEISSGHLYVKTIGTGPAVIALPGFAGTSSTWKSLAEELQDLFQFHLVDFLGYGLSDKPSHADFSPVGQARQIEELMKKLQIDRCILLSNSASAQPALHAAFRQPRRFEANIMVAPFISPGFWLKRLIRIAAIPQAKFLISGLFGVRLFVHLANKLGSYQSDRISNDLVDEQYLPFGTSGYWASLSKSIKHLEPVALTGIMQMIPTPTLVIWGDRDRAGNIEKAKSISAAISDRQFEVISECGHLVQEERTRETATLIREYIAKLRKRPTTTAPNKSGPRKTQPESR